jgi:hypothetical protein
VAAHTRTSEHADFGGGWVEIFRAGDYGAKGKFTPADLDRIVSNYDPDFHEAPAVVGHPEANAPAFGWTRALMRDGDVLKARFAQVDPAFEEAVKAGRYKKRSAAFYLDSEGKITNLRHVGFLGGAPPEVKGLADLKFDDNGRVFTEVDFGEEEPVSATEKSIKETIVEIFAEMFGKKTEPKTFSEDEAKRVAAQAAEAAAAPLKAELATMKTAFEAQTAKFTERETALAGGEVKQRAAAAVAKLRSAGKWIPAFEKMGLVTLFGELAKETKTIEFGEGDAKKTLTPLDTLVAFLESLPKIVPGGVVFNGALGGKTDGAAVSPKDNPLTIAARARAKEAKISFNEALLQVAQENPELTVVGTGSVGGV